MLAIAAVAKVIELHVKIGHSDWMHFYDTAIDARVELPIFIDKLRDLRAEQNKDLNTYIDSRIGLDSWNDYVSKFGLGTKINYELNSEAKGFLPDKNYYNDLYGRNRWKFSNIYSLSIGQGELLVSPIQMANLAAIISNRGNYIAPHII